MASDLSALSSGYTDYMNIQAQDMTVNKMQDTIKSDFSTATDDELMDVCKQFEAYFVEQMFKEMQKTVPETEYSSAGTSNMMGYYKDEMVKKVAEDTTNQQGMGLANTLYEQMKRNYDL